MGLGALNQDCHRWCEVGECEVGSDEANCIKNTWNCTDPKSLHKMSDRHHDMFIYKMFSSNVYSKECAQKAILVFLLLAR